MNRTSEPDSGLDPEDIAHDIAIIDNQTLHLRAERGDQGDGRIYTITYEATDASGNSTTAVTTVVVPHHLAQAAGVDQGAAEYNAYLPFLP